MPEDPYPPTNNPYLPKPSTPGTPDEMLDGPGDPYPRDLDVDMPNRPVYESEPPSASQTASLSRYIADVDSITQRIAGVRSPEVIPTANLVQAHRDGIPTGRIARMALRRHGFVEGEYQFLPTPPDDNEFHANPDAYAPFSEPFDDEYGEGDHRIETEATRKRASDWAKECPNCGRSTHKNAPSCAHCGGRFPDSEWDMVYTAKTAVPDSYASKSASGAPIAAKKVAEITNDIIATNPDVPTKEARRLAERTLREHPEMLKQAASDDHRQGYADGAADADRGVYRPHERRGTNPGRAYAQGYDEGYEAAGGGSPFATPELNPVPSGGYRAWVNFYDPAADRQETLHHVFETEESAEAWVSGMGRTYDVVDSGIDKRSSRKTADLAPDSVGVGIGSIFVSSWGYDQTNVDFYEVVGLTPAGVRVHPVASTIIEGAGGPNTLVVPVPGKYRSSSFDNMDGITPVTKRLLGSGNYIYIKVRNGHGSARLWDGEPMRETGLGWGH